MGERGAEHPCRALTSPVGSGQGAGGRAKGGSGTQGRRAPHLARTYLSIRSTSARCSTASSVLSACSSLRMGGVS